MAQSLQFVISPQKQGFCVRKQQILFDNLLHNGGNLEQRDSKMVSKRSLLFTKCQQISFLTYKMKEK